MKKNGFALLMTLLVLLLLTAFGFGMLLLAGSYFRSTKNLHGNEDARFACEYATKFMLDRHNFGAAAPRFFFDSQLWQGGNMTPFQWNGYRIEAKLPQTWSDLSMNLFQVSAKKGKFVSQQTIGLKQRRLEDFALYSDADLSFSESPLFDGLVYSRGMIDLAKPDVRFRDIGQASMIQPLSNATFRKWTLQFFPYPQLDQQINFTMVHDHAQQNGFLIINRNPLFWNADHYEIDLNRLEFIPAGPDWRILYNGVELGTFHSLHLCFDDRLQIKQTVISVDLLPSNKPVMPLSLSTSSDIELNTNLQALSSNTTEHPLLLISGGVLFLKSALPRASYFSSTIVVLGSTTVGSKQYSVLMEPGGPSLTPGEKQVFLSEVRNSSFVLEPTKRDPFITALQNDRKIVWFRGSLVIQAAIQQSADLEELHFETSRHRHALLPAFPFIHQLESSRQWQ